MKNILKTCFLIKTIFFCLFLTLIMTGCPSEKKAEMAGPDYQYLVATQYHKGGNYTKAAYWYEKAASHDHIAARVRLACLYYDGLGVTQDYTKALELFEISSCTGKSTTADYYLFFMYMRGQGVERNYEKAIKYITNLVNKDERNAIKTLAYMYYTGKGVPQSYKEAAKLFDMAYRTGSTSAAIDLAFMYEQGLGVRLDYAMADKLRAEAVTKLTVLNKDSGSMTYNAIQGYSPSDTDPLTPYILANFYQFGMGGLPTDAQKAQKLYAQARKKLRNISNYETELAIMYHYSLGGKQDYVKAAELYAIGVNQDNEVAMFGLGELYKHGLGVEQNYAEAVKLYTLASRYGVAEKELGDLYAQGLGVEKDINKAFELYTKSAIRGRAEGQYALANAYFHGLGSNKSNVDAWLWILVAAENRGVYYYYDDEEKNETINNINQLKTEINKKITLEELEAVETSL